MEETIRAAWAARDGEVTPAARAAIDEVIGLLDRGELRVAVRIDGQWQVNDWVQMAILLCFRYRPSRPMEAGALHFHDKLPVQKGHGERGVRVVPPGTARYGSHLEPGVVLMPGYVNIGAYIGAGSMIDTWATVGSGAQIGRNVHISGGVGIGGVLEPPQSFPVIVEDDAFIGSRCVLVEGSRVAERAVLGAGCVLTASTPVVDVRGPEPQISRGGIPAGCVAIPGAWPRCFPAGRFQVPCVLIIGERGESTQRKTQLNELLREFPLEMGQGS